jgi:hypothetical protein
MELLKMKSWFASALLLLSFNGFANTINEVIRFQTMGFGLPPMQLQAELRIPPQAQPPYKTVILQHSSGPNVNLLTFKGRTDNVAHTVGLEALKRGYAVIFTDSFSQAISFRGCTQKRVQFTEDGRFMQGEDVFDYNEYKKRCHIVGATSMGPGDMVPAVAVKVLNYFDGF